MLLKACENATSLAGAAEDAEASMRKAIAGHDRCRLVLATGNSQIKFLENLTAKAGVNWIRVEVFHFDESVGLAKAREIIAVVPDLRRARAVKMCREGEIRPASPASILRTHPNAMIYLDRDSSSLLSPETRKEPQLMM